MSNRYSLSPTDSPRTTYRVIDHSRDDEPARHPATLPSGAPHPLAGRPVSVVTSPSRAYKVAGEGRARTWDEIGGYGIARIEQVPAWAAAPASTVLREDHHAFDGIPEELLAGGRPVRAALVRGPAEVGRRPRRAAPGPGLAAPSRPPAPAAPLAGPLRGRRLSRPVGPTRPEAPPKRPVRPSDGLAPAPRYLHLGTGALCRLRACDGPTETEAPPAPTSAEPVLPPKAGGTPPQAV